jgi:preprotein translocase YajC subunit
MELVVILAVFLAFVFFSNRRRGQQAKALEASVVVGAQVIMLGGIKGKVVSILEGSVIVESTPGTRIEFLKAAVRSVVPASLDVKAVTGPKPKAKPAVAKKPLAKAPKTTATKKTAK